MRKNQATLTSAEKTAFVNAVLALKQNPSLLHPENSSLSRYDDFVEVHLNGMMVMMNNQPSWAHQGPVFGPWHRVLLRQFELELQKIDAQVEIPYWDWTRMKNPALTGGVSLKFKLRLTRLLLALVPNVLPNRRFVNAHRGGKKSSCPDPTPIPIYFGQIVREFLFQSSARHTFQDLHHL